MIHFREFADCLSVWVKVWTVYIASNVARLPPPVALYVCAAFLDQCEVEISPILWFLLCNSGSEGDVLSLVVPSLRHSDYIPAHYLTQLPWLPCFGLGGVAGCDLVQRFQSVAVNASSPCTEHPLRPLTTLSHDRHTLTKPGSGIKAGRFAVWPSSPPTPKVTPYSLTPTLAWFPRTSYH